MTDEELIEELSEMGRHPCRAHLPMGERLRQAADRIEALTAENEALKKSGRALLNAKHKEAAEAELWFEKGQALAVENKRLRKALERIGVATRNEARADGKGYVSRYGINGIVSAALEKQP